MLLPPIFQEMIPSIQVKSKEDLSYMTVIHLLFFYYELELFFSHVSKFLPSFYALQLLSSHPSYPLFNKSL